MTTTPASSPFGANILPWFMLLALAMGAAPLAVNTPEISHPRIVIAALLGLLLFSVATRLTSPLKRRVRLRCTLEIAALLVFSVLIAAASGGVRSTSLPLFLLPLTAAAISLPRVAFALTAGLVALAYLLLGALTPDIEIGSSAFVVHLIGTIAPALVTTGAIAMLVTHMQLAEFQIHTLSNSDALTGLYNSAAFERRLATEHRKAERSARPYSIIIVDLDNLAQLTESAGQDAANQMLLAVTAALQRSIRTTDVAARLGGNEFAVLLLDADPTTAGTIAQRIRTAVYAGTIALGKRLVRANVSIGAANFPKDHLAAPDILLLAEQRLQQDRDSRAAR